MRRPRRSRRGPSTPSICSAASTSSRESTAHAPLPHPMGLDAHVLPSGNEEGGIRRPAYRDHVRHPAPGVFLTSSLTRRTHELPFPRSLGAFVSNRALFGTGPGAALHRLCLSGRGSTRHDLRSQGGWTGLAPVTGIEVTGKGVTARVVETFKRIGPQEITLLRDQLKELKDGNKTPDAATTKLDGAYRKAHRGIFQPSRQRGPCRSRLSRNRIAADAAPGRREIRLVTPAGITNPLAFPRRTTARVYPQTHAHRALPGARQGGAFPPQTTRGRGRMPRHALHGERTDRLG
jgi:hypothetical protein